MSNTAEFALDGFLNVLKPPGLTSHDVIGSLRRILKTKKIGHAGTLDPGAAGVLPIAVGRATRFIEYLAAVGKSYRAELLFGVETDSGDDTGTAVARAPEGWEFPTTKEVLAGMKTLTGDITQVPPVYSAVKIDGKRAADLARSNKEVRIPPRQVTIYRFDLLAEDRERKTLLLDVDCSKGTYIRSLCTDLGRAVGIPATMSFLVRTRVGEFPLQEAVSLEELARIAQEDFSALPILPPENYLGHFPRYDLPAGRLKAFTNGLPTHDVRFAETLRATGRESGEEMPLLLTVWCEGKFCGIGRFNWETESVHQEKLYI